MKHSLFLISITCILQFNLSFGQNVVTDTSATLITYWSEGETQTLHISQSKSKFKKGTLISEEASSYTAQIKVLEETETSYTIQWTYKNISALKSKDPFSKRIAKMTEGLKVIYKTDEVGIFSGIVNLTEIQQYMNTSLDVIISEYENNPDLAPAMNQVRAIFSSKEAIEQLVIRDIQLYHSVYGSEYILNEEYSGETLLPNVLGGDPFPAIITVEMTKLIPYRNYAKFVMKQFVDPDKVMESIQNFTKEMAEKSGGSAPDNQPLPKMDIYDYNEFEAQLETGWLSRAYYRRTVEADEAKIVESYEIILK